MSTTLILGGARSGKSRFAVERHASSARVVFVATAAPGDADMAARIARHRAERRPDWTTIEAPYDLVGAVGGAGAETDSVIVDCLTVWVANLQLRGDDDAAILSETRRLVALIRGVTFDVTIVSNEVGEGVHPETHAGLRFRDTLGRVNQEMAAACDGVTLMVAGLPLPLKPRGTATLSSPIHTPEAATMRLSSLLTAIRPPEPGLTAAASRHVDELTKPRGSLGRVEEIAVRLAALAGGRPTVERPAIFTFAADHGVVAEGVSAYPQTVTAQMVENFLAGGAAISVLARQAGARLVVADFGVATRIGPRPGLIERRCGDGTANMARGPAMTREQAIEAIEAGAALADGALRDGVDLVATGEMGIGNTTAASAITAALTGVSPDIVTGRGTGLDDPALAHKIEVVQRALAVNVPRRDDAVDVLAKVGGFEIAGLVGVILAAAARRVPVALDGFISGAAALVAARLAPDARHAMFASHRSAEPGHRVILDDLGLEPYLDLSLRLGEGTGAALFVHLARAAAHLYSEMATFKSAGVDRRTAGAGAEPA